MRKDPLVFPEIPGGLPEGRALGMDDYLAFVMANRIRFDHLKSREKRTEKRVYVPFVLDADNLTRKAGDERLVGQ